jgi:hypothetical protein
MLKGGKGKREEEETRTKIGLSRITKSICPNYHVNYQYRYYEFLRANHTRNFWRKVHVEASEEALGGSGR